MKYNWNVFMLRGSGSLWFALCGLAFPSNIERFVLVDQDCFVSFPLLCSILVHEYPAVLFIQLLMGRYLSHLHYGTMSIRVCITVGTWETFSRACMQLWDGQVKGHAQLFERG